MKLEWTSILSDRLFLSVLGAQWYNFFPLRPTYEGGFYDRDSLQPGRIDIPTGQLFDGGANNTYQDRKRYKPQFATTLSYFKDGWKGSHDLKLGFEWKRDRRHEGNDQPFDIFYRDRGGVPVEVDLYNTTVVATTDVNNHSLYLRDDWKLTNRLTLNLGLRIEHYVDGWPEQTADAERYSRCSRASTIRESPASSPIAPSARATSRTRGRPARASASPTTSAARAARS